MSPLTSGKLLGPRVRLAGLFLALSFLAASPAAAQSGGLTGFVTDTNNSGVAGATVRVIAGPALRSTVTGANGSYTIPSLPRGAYRVTASADGFTSSVRDAVVGDTPVRLDFRIRREADADTGILTGLITDRTTGAGIPGATIEISNDRNSRTALTNAAGEYRFENVPAGFYRMLVSRDGYVRGIRSAVRVRAGQTTTVNMALRPRSSEQGRIFGRVTAAGAGVSGAAITLLSDGRTAGSTQTGSQGEYELTRVLSGIYDLRVKAAGFAERIVRGIRVDPGQRVRVDVALTNLGNEVGNVEGFVLDATGEPINGASVQVTEGPVTGQFDVTDSTGAFAIRNLPAGEYVLEASATGFLSRTAGVEVLANQTASVTFNLQRGDSGGRGSLGGRVTLADGQGVARVLVRVTAGPVSDRSAESDSDGDYVLRDLPVGTYSVSYSRDGFRQRTVTGIQITNGQRTTQDVILEPADQGGTAQIFGTVSDSDAVAVAGARVEALKGDDVVSSAISSSTGFYRLRNLAAGAYSVRTTRTGFTTRTISNVEISDGEQRRLDIVLTRSGGGGADAGRIRGTVTSVAGQRISGAKVVLNGPSSAQTFTDGNGGYEFPSVDAGSGYSISVSATGFTTQVKRDLTVRAGETLVVDFRLSSGGGSGLGSVIGNVRNQSGFAVQNARVTVVSGPTEGAAGTTDRAGTYRIGDLAPGVYILEASAPGHRSARASVTVRSGQESRRDFFIQMIIF